MGTVLGDLFDTDLFDRMIGEGFIRLQTHPDDPMLVVANYTERTQYERAWNDATLNCRGLIYNAATRQVLARPFAKFFNWDEAIVGKIPVGPMIKAPKMDGSLGILYPTPSNGFGFQSAFAIATRGSFASEQAKRGTQMFLPKAMQSGFAPREGYTYVFEILYPENRIVVDYGGFSGLVLLDVLDIATGKPDHTEFDACEWSDKVSKVSVKDGFSVDLAHEIGPNEEGFVLYWPFHDLRVKMKGAEYVRLHKILTGIDTVKVWEILAAGKTVEDLLDGANVPDEFFDWMKTTASDLHQRHEQVLREIEEDFATYRDLALVDNGGTAGDDPREFRKVFANQARHSKYTSAMFSLFDGKDISDLVWKICKPVRVAPWEEGGKL